MGNFVVDVLVESRYPVNRGRIRGVVVKVLDAYGVKDAAVSVRIVGDRKMKGLNETYRKIASTTDVLSFPTEEVAGKAGEFVYPKEEPFPLGDVVISFPKALMQAMERDVLVDEEIDALIEHGVKSLLGYHPDMQSE